MFGKKNGIPVQHYEGIEEFATDYPCRLELNNDTLIITRIKPETTVTLPRNRIKSISAMEESKFMQKYHGNAVPAAKCGKKYFLVIHYDKGFLVFWGTAKEYGEFVKMQFELTSASKHISL